MKTRYDVQTASILAAILFCCSTAYSQEPVRELMKNCEAKLSDGKTEQAIKLLNDTKVSEIVSKQLEQANKVFLASEGYRVSLILLNDEFAITDPKSVLVLPGLGEHDRIDSEWARSAVSFATEFNLLMFAELVERQAIDPMVTLMETRDQIQLTEEAWDAIPKLEKLKLQQFAIRHFLLQQKLIEQDKEIFGESFEPSDNREITLHCSER